MSHKKSNNPVTVGLIERDELERVTSAISLENANKLTTGLIVGYNRITKLVGLGGEAVSRILSETSDDRIDIIPIGPITDDINKIGYVRASGLSIIVPIGLQADFLTYAKALNETKELVETLISENLTPFNDWVVTCLGDPKMLTKISKVSNYRKKDIDSLTKGVAKCFKQGSSTEYTTYGEYVKRTADYAEGIELLNELTSVYNMVDVDAVKRAVDTGNTNLELLVKRLDAKDEGYAISKQAILNISELTLDMAKAVELYAVIRYRLETVLKSINDAAVAMKHAI